MKMNRNVIIVLGAVAIGLVFFFVNGAKQNDKEDEVATKPANRIAMPSAAPAPYTSDALNGLYNLIFCDRTELVESKMQKPYPYPYNVLFSPTSSVEELRSVITDSGTDTRVRIVAWNKLRERSLRNKQRVVLGVVIEIGMENGLDVLAVYDDLAARYINQSGKVLVNEKADIKSGLLIAKMLKSADSLAPNMQPADARGAFPVKGIVKLTLITTDGLCSAEGGPDVMFQGAKTAPVLRAGTELLQLLMAQATAAEAKKKHEVVR